MFPKCNATICMQSSLPPSMRTQALCASVSLWTQALRSPSSVWTQALCAFIHVTVDPSPLRIHPCGPRPSAPPSVWTWALRTQCPRIGLTVG